MSASPATQGYMNGRPKLLLLNKYRNAEPLVFTSSFIISKTNQIIPQLLVSRSVGFTVPSIKMASIIVSPFIRRFSFHKLEYCAEQKNPVSSNIELNP
jgi:hypothetical protein